MFKHSLLYNNNMAIIIKHCVNLNANQLIEIQRQILYFRNFSFALLNLSTSNVQQRLIIFITLKPSVCYITAWNSWHMLQVIYFNNIKHVTIFMKFTNIWTMIVIRIDIYQVVLHTHVIRVYLFEHNIYCIYNM